MRTREYILIFFLLDVFLLNLSIMVSELIHGVPLIRAWPPSVLTVILNSTWVLSYLIFIDDFQYFKFRFPSFLRTIGQRLAIFIAITFLVVLSFDIEYHDRTVLLVPILVFIVFKILVSIYLYTRMTFKRRGRSPVIIVGDNANSQMIFRYSKENSLFGFRPLGILTEEGKGSGPNVIGKIEDFEKIYESTPFNDVIISLPLNEAERINRLIGIAERLGVRPRVVPYWYNVINRNFIIGSLGTIPLLDLRNIPLYKYPNRFWKRAFDIVVASVMLIMLIPVFPIVALLIKLDSKGPVFYKPIRLGVNNKPFHLFKFRTMSESDDIHKGAQSTTINDPRITRIGKYLRKYNIDELPQLFNVIMNEMSIVGPRPHRVHLNKNLQSKMNFYMVRHFVKPGITGWAQVNGWRGPTENRLQYVGRTLHDIWYIEHWNFWLDVYIMFLTAFGKKARENAF